jgi:hypothetical protein
MVAQVQIESGEIQCNDSSCRAALVALLSDSAQVRLPPPGPRHKLPVTLLAAGGHDPSWHNLR